MRYGIFYRLTVAATYAAILLWFIYHDDNVPAWAGYMLLFVLPFAASFASGPWVALVLPLVVLAAVPAGYGSGEAEIPIWVAVTLVAIVALPVIVVGSFARWLVIRYATRAGGA